MFTEPEKTILDATGPRYKYIQRIRGNLYLKTENVDGFIDNFYCYNHIFKDVKDGDDPICFRKPILDDAEREYLKAVFKPFAKRINYVGKSCSSKGYFIYASVDHGGGIGLPYFDGKEMYKGMEPEKDYSLEELGITYDN